MEFDSPIPSGWWCGHSWATKQDIDGIRSVYGRHSFAEYRFMVENNLNRVEVTTRSRASCGIETLANMMVRYDLTPRQIAGMAAKMRRAVEVYEQSCL